MTEQKLITRSAELLVERGFHQIASLRDEHGINCTLFKHDERGDEVFMVVSKQYAFRQLASFQKKQVEAAAKEGFTLIFYEDEDETFTVFEPETVQEFSKPSHGKSKRADTEWRELSLDYGLPLDRYLGGETTTLPDGQVQLTAY